MKIQNRFKFRFSLFLSFLLLAAISFSSCENSVQNNSSSETLVQGQNQNPDSDNPSTGKIRILLSQPQSGRTVLPQIDFSLITSITLTGVKDGVTKNCGTWTSKDSLEAAAIAFLPGDWALTLTATFENGCTFSDTQNVTVTVGNTENVAFTLTSDSTSGGISIILGFTGDAVAAKYTITGYPGNSPVSGGSGNLSVDTTNHRVSYSRDPITAGLPQGNYRITIDFYGDTGTTILLNSWSQIIRISGGFTSTTSQNIDLNNLLHVYYHENEGTINDTAVQNFSMRSAAFDLPADVVKEGYVFDGWYTDEFCTSGNEITSVAAGTGTDVNVYAKWKQKFALTYVIENNGKNKTIDVTNTLTASTLTNPFPTYAVEGETTTLGAPDPVFATGSNVVFNGYSVASYDSTLITASGSDYVIPAVSANSIIYLHVSPNYVYVDPTADNNDGLAFNPETPAKTVEMARYWLKGATTNPVLYVKSSITQTSDISALASLSVNPDFGGAIVKRYPGFTNSPLINHTTSTASPITLTNLTIDGGADWGSLSSTACVSDGNNTGMSVTAPLITVGADANLTMNNIQIINNDNTSTSGTTVNILGTVTMYNCKINKCKASNGAAINVSGTLTITQSEYKYNYSTGNGGAIVCGTNSNVSITSSQFDTNETADDGGAIYNLASTNPLTLKECYFTNNDTIAGGGGANIYNSGLLKLKSDISMEDGDIYFDNGSANASIILDSDFTSDYIITTYAYDYNNKNMLNLSAITDNTYKEYAKDLFELDSGHSDDYEIVLEGEAGKIKPKPGSLTITPGFPENYVCEWSQTHSGSTYSIVITLKDKNGSPVSPVSGSLKVDIYEGLYSIAQPDSLTFDYPSYLGVPSGTPFRVQFNVQADSVSAYSYNYWPEQIWIGNKAPDVTKEVGDIVFKDGSAMTYSDFAALDSDVQNTKKASAIALIFYKGTDLNSGGDTTTSRTLGVGLKHNKSGLAWCSSAAEAYQINIPTIQCPASGSAYSYTFTGDKNGSNNLEQIKLYGGIGDTTGEGAAAKYPAFYFAKNYKDISGSNVSDSDYETGWYLPSIAELFQIYVKGKGTSKVFDIDAASQALGGDSFGTSFYWSSSQYELNPSSARIFGFNYGIGNDDKPHNTRLACCIREF